MKCQYCNTELKLLFSSWYCPRDCKSYKSTELIRKPLTLEPYQTIGLKVITQNDDYLGVWAYGHTDIGDDEAMEKLTPFLTKADEGDLVAQISYIFLGIQEEDQLVATTPTHVHSTWNTSFYNSNTGQTAPVPSPWQYAQSVPLAVCNNCNMPYVPPVNGNGQCDDCNSGGSTP